MADLSEEQQFKTLLIMLKRSTKFLCQVFRRLWKDETKNEWDDTTPQNNLTLLDKRALKHLQSLKSIVKPYRRLEHLHISTLTESLLCFRQLTNNENDYIATATLQKIENDLESTWPRTISTDDFSTKLEGIRHSLECLGMEKEEFDNLAAAAKAQCSTKENRAEALLRLAKHQYMIEKKEAEAYELFKRVAEMDATSAGETTLYKCNRSVAEAQRCLGTIHDAKGIHWDEKQAAFWYEKSMENGNGLAAMGMGTAYTKGAGVEVNPDMAEMCFMESVNLKSPRAAVSLVRHYWWQLEVEKAETVYKIWVANRPQLLLHITQEHYKMVEEEKRRLRNMMERQVENFENERGLDKGRLSFLQRTYRSLRHLYPNIEYAAAVMEAGILLAHAPHCFATAYFEDEDARVEARKYVGGSESQTKKLIFSVFMKRCMLFRLVAKEGQLEEDDKLKVLDLLYEMLKTGIRLVCYDILVNEKLLQILKILRRDIKYQDKGEVDEKLTLCYAMSNLFAQFDVKGAWDMLKEGAKRYPDNSIYISVICLYLGKKCEWEKAHILARAGLKKDANNVELMFFEAVFFSLLNSDINPDECLAKYKMFIKKAPQDDPNVPDAWFAIAGLHLQKLEKKMDSTVYFRNVGSGMKSVKKNFEEGLKAEELQLSCFSPYQKSVMRLKVELTLDLWKGNGQTRAVAESSLENEQDTASEPSFTILDRKIYLRSPTRKGLIKLHRQNIKQREDGMEDIELYPEIYEESGDPPKLPINTTEGRSSLKTITLLEINPFVEHILEGCVLNLTILVEPDLSFGFLASVAEDRNRDVIRVHVYNFEEEDDIIEKFSVGSRIIVMNPHLSMTTSDLHSCIRIDDLKCVTYQEKVRSMCGFCGEEDSSHHCSKCKRIYCSKECEDLDMERHAHNLICS